MYLFICICKCICELIFICISPQRVLHRLWRQAFVSGAHRPRSPSQIAQQPIATVRIAQSQPHSTLPIATLHIAQSIATVYIAQSIATYLSDKARGSSKALEVWKKN